MKAKTGVRAGLRMRSYYEADSYLPMENFTVGGGAQISKENSRSKIQSI
jgi:hypothetical protein